MMGFLAVSTMLVALVVVRGGPLDTNRDRLVTMTSQELVEILRCVSKSRDPQVQRRFEECNNMMSPQMVSALEKCQVTVIPDGMKKCNYYSVLYDFPEFSPKLITCIYEITNELTEEENRKMVDFEKCARNVYSQACH